MFRILILVLLLTGCSRSSDDQFIPQPTPKQDNGLIVIPGKILFDGSELKPQRITVDITLTDSTYTYKLQTFSKQ